MVMLAARKHMALVVRVIITSYSLALAWPSDVRWCEARQANAHLDVFPISANAGVHHVFWAGLRPADSQDRDNEAASDNDLASTCRHPADRMRLPGIALQGVHPP